MDQHQNYDKPNANKTSLKGIKQTNGGNHRVNGSVASNKMRMKKGPDFNQTSFNGRINNFIDESMETL